MDILPKLSDIKNLKDLSKIIVLPLLCASYISQSDFSLNFGDYLYHLDISDSEGLKIFKFVIIFFGKIFFSSYISFIASIVLAFFHMITKGIATQLFILSLFTFGVLGVFAGDRITPFFHIQALWYFASFAAAFYLLTVSEKLILEN